MQKSESAAKEHWITRSVNNSTACNQQASPRAVSLLLLAVRHPEQSLSTAAGSKASAILRQSPQTWPLQIFNWISKDVHGNTWDLLTGLTSQAGHTYHCNVKRGFLGQESWQQLKRTLRLAMVAHTFDPTTQEAKAGRPKSLKITCPT